MHLLCICLHCKYIFWGEGKQPQEEIKMYYRLRCKGKDYVTTDYIQDICSSSANFNGVGMSQSVTLSLRSKTAPQEETPTDANMQQYQALIRK